MLRTPKGMGMRREFERKGKTRRRGVGGIRLVLARIFYDVQNRLLASNPARGVKLPKRPPRRNAYLTASQLNKLADESALRVPGPTRP